MSSDANIVLLRLFEFKLHFGWIYVDEFQHLLANYEGRNFYAQYSYLVQGLLSIVVLGDSMRVGWDKLSSAAYKKLQA